MTKREVLIAAMNKAGLATPTVDEMLADKTLLENTLKSDGFSKAFWGEAVACPNCGSLERHQDVILDRKRNLVHTEKLQLQADPTSYLEPYL